MTIKILLPKSERAWHAARAKCVTASVAGALLGVYPHKTKYRLWAEKSGLLTVDSEENAAMRKGRLLEPVAVEMMKEDFAGWRFSYRRDNAFYYDPKLRIGATPDAFAFRPEYNGWGVVQIKIVSEDVLANEWTDEDGDVSPPDWIALQALVEAKMTGAPWAAVYVVAVGRGITGRMIDVPIHEGLWNTLVAKTAEFWRVVETGERPTPDWDKDAQTVAAIWRKSRPNEVDLTEDAKFDATVEAFESCRVARKGMQDREAVLRAQVLHRMEDNAAALTRSYHVRASSTMKDDGNYSRRITIKQRKI